MWVLGCGVSPGAEARERWGAGALPRTCHGGGEVAVVELDLDSVARGGGIQRGVEWGQEVAGVPRVAVEQQERGGRRELDYFAISEKFSCKTKITPKLGLKRKSAPHESCSTFQDLQLWCCAKIDLTKG